METLESRILDLEAELSLAGDWNDRYRMLVEWGESLESLPVEDQNPEWAVPGCSSPLWFRVRWSHEAIEVRGASPGIVPKALVAVVSRLYDGLTTVETSPVGLSERLGLSRNLSPTRAMVFERLLMTASEVLRKGP